MQALFDIQRATIAARQRIGEFAPLTDWLPIKEAIRALEAL